MVNQKEPSHPSPEPQERDPSPKPHLPPWDRPDRKHVEPDTPWPRR